MNLFDNIFVILTFAWYIFYGLTFINIIPNAQQYFLTFVFYYQIYVCLLLIFYFNPYMNIKLNNVNWVEVFEMVMREKNLIHDVNPSGSVITVHTYEVAGEQSASYEKALDSKIKVINSLSSFI